MQNGNGEHAYLFGNSIDIGVRFTSNDGAISLDNDTVCFTVAGDFTLLKERVELESHIQSICRAFLKGRDCNLLRFDLLQVGDTPPV